MVTKVTQVSTGTIFTPATSAQPPQSSNRLNASDLSKTQFSSKEKKGCTKLIEAIKSIFQKILDCFKAIFCSKGNKQATSSITSSHSKESSSAESKVPTQKKPNATESGPKESSSTEKPKGSTPKTPTASEAARYNQKPSPTSSSTDTASAQLQNDPLATEILKCANDPVAYYKEHKRAELNLDDELALYKQEQAKRNLQPSIPTGTASFELQGDPLATEILKLGSDPAAYFKKHSQADIDLDSEYAQYMKEHHPNLVPSPVHSISASQPSDLSLSTRATDAPRLSAASVVSQQTRTDTATTSLFKSTVQDKPAAAAKSVDDTKGSSKPADAKAQEVSVATNLSLQPAVRDIAFIVNCSHMRAHYDLEIEKRVNCIRALLTILNHVKTNQDVQDNNKLREMLEKVRIEQVMSIPLTDEGRLDKEEKNKVFAAAWQDIKFTTTRASYCEKDTSILGKISVIINNLIDEAGIILSKYNDFIAQENQAGNKQNAYEYRMAQKEYLGKVTSDLSNLKYAAQTTLDIAANLSTDDVNKLETLRDKLDSSQQTYLAECWKPYPERPCQEEETSVANPVPDSKTNIPEKTSLDVADIAPKAPSFFTEKPLSFLTEEVLLSMTKQVLKCRSRVFEIAAGTLDNITNPKKKYEVFIKFTSAVCDEIKAYLMQKPEMDESATPIDIANMAKKMMSDRTTDTLNDCINFSNEFFSKLTREEISKMKGHPTVPPQHYIHNMLIRFINDHIIKNFPKNDQYYRALSMNLFRFIGPLLIFNTPNFTDVFEDNLKDFK